MPQTLKEGSKSLSTTNWKVYHPSTGKHMFTCGHHRAMWYLDRNLAKYIDKENRIIQLTFKPNGRGFPLTDKFGLASRKVKCVVSGKTKELQKHHIVPYCYRTHFPLEYKSKNHHDVVLIHYKEHEAYEIEANKFKDQLADEYGIKRINDLNLEYTRAISAFSEEKLRMLSRFHSIFRSAGKLPKDKLLETIGLISKYTYFSSETLLKLNLMQLYKIYKYLRRKHEAEFEYFKNENYSKYDHGFLMYSKLDTEQKLTNFIKKWRRHFIETMNPQHMPDGWSIDYRVKTENYTNL
jgi:hypothetical protein